MKLVVDTSVLFSFFRENPVRFTILNCNSFKLELLVPEYAFDELKNNRSSLMKYSGIKTSNELESILSMLESLIKVIPLSFFEEFKAEACEIAPHEKDSPFFALSLKFNCAIWSNDPGFKRQSKIKVFNTKELLKKLNEDPDNE